MPWIIPRVTPAQALLLFDTGDGRPLEAVHTVSQYGRPSVALLQGARCRYTCQVVIPGLWPEEAFPRVPLLTAPEESEAALRLRPLYRRVDVDAVDAAALA